MCGVTMKESSHAVISVTERSGWTVNAGHTTLVWGGFYCSPPNVLTCFFLLSSPEKMISTHKPNPYLTFPTVPGWSFSTLAGGISQTVYPRCVFVLLETNWWMKAEAAVSGTGQSFTLSGGEGNCMWIKTSSLELYAADLSVVLIGGLEGVSGKYCSWPVSRTRKHLMDDVSRWNFPQCSSGFV